MGNSTAHLCPEFLHMQTKKIWVSYISLSDSNNIILVGYEMGIANQESILKYIIYKNLCRRNWGK